MWKTLNVRLVGATPLLMHRGLLADPLDPFTKAIKEVSGRRKKSDADFEELARLEFLGSLYLHDGAPCLPGEMIEACIVAGARRTKDGKQATAGVLCPSNYPLAYNGPRSPEDLWKDDRFRLRALVKVGMGRVVRTRPRFDQWSCDVPVDFNDDLVNAKSLANWLTTAGLELGIGDWRPRFGRFTVEAL